MDLREHIEVKDIILQANILASKCEVHYKPAGWSLGRGTVQSIAG